LQLGGNLAILANRVFFARSHSIFEKPLNVEHDRDEQLLE
jgi:hypothetical protein